MKNQDVTIEVLKFVHKEGKATRGKIEEWLRNKGVDLENEYVKNQIITLLNRRNDVGLHCVENSGAKNSEDYVYGLKVPTYFSLLNYYNFKQAEKDSKSAEKHSKKAICLSLYALCISAFLAVCSIGFSVYSIFWHTPTVKIYEEKIIKPNQTSDNKPIIKSVPHMTKGE